MSTAHRPKAYSYIRFSTPEQANGDSLRRQTEAARVYASSQGLDLDQELTFADPGVSAYRGRNAEDGALGGFLGAVRDGLVPQGSYLLVESLDRVSRQTVRKAVRTMEDIVAAGVNLVDLSDGGKVYSTESLDNDPMAFLLMAIRFMRAHEESATKSRRLLSAYEQKRAVAASKTPAEKPFTRMLPAWLLWDDDARAHVAIPERASVLKSIFEKADAGWGQHRIARWLNEQGTETWGGRGKQRKATYWHRSYVKKLLINSAVAGTFTPHQRRANGDGTRTRKPFDPIENYFPVVVDRELFERVASRASAIAPRGRNALNAPVSIFAGVLRCTHCGGLVIRISKGDYEYLVCSSANRKGTLGCKYQTVHYGDVEQAVRQNANSIIEDAPRGRGPSELEDEIAALDDVASIIADEARDLADEFIREKSGVLRQRLRDKEAELERARENLRVLRSKRDTFGGPYVRRRLTTLKSALRAKPFDVVNANKALKEAVSKIVLDAEAGRLTIHWRHSTVTTGEIPFFSRHSHAFDEEPTIA